MSEAATQPIAAAEATNPATTAADAPIQASNDTPVTSSSDAAPNTESDTSADSDSTPAADARDWFMRDKFATEVDQAKAYPELLKKMGKNWGAPKDDYTLDSIEGIIKDDPLLSHLKPALKELGLSQDGFASLIKGYQDANVKLGETIAKQVQQELVAKDAATVTAVDQWISKSFDEAQQKTIRSWIVSVEDFQILNQLRVLMPVDTSVPSSTAGNAIKFESVQEVENEKIKYRKEISERLRVPDKNFENDLQQRWRDAYTREEYTKKK